MISKEEAEKYAEELVKLTLQQKETSEKIKKLKGELLEYTNLSNIADLTWMVDNGYVEVSTKTQTKLADVPAELKVPSDVAAIDIAEKAFKAKISLTKEGKRMLQEQHPSIVKLVIKTLKKKIHVVV